MAEDGKGEGANKRLNDLVAITVVLFSVVAAVSNIKDDNVVQAIDEGEIRIGRRLGRISGGSPQAARRRKRPIASARARNDRHH